MSSVRQKCPVCGTWTESKEVVKNSAIRDKGKQYAKKTAKTSIRTVVAAKGAAIGSAIFPGVGTVVGGFVGFFASMGLDSAVNDCVDLMGDNVEHSFQCPHCAYSWQMKSPAVSDTSIVANSNTHRIRKALLQDIMQCTHQNSVGEGNSLVYIGLEGNKTVEFLNILKRKYNIVMFAVDIKSCHTVKALLDRIITEHPEIQNR